MAENPFDIVFAEPEDKPKIKADKSEKEASSNPFDKVFAKKEEKPTRYKYPRNCYIMKCDCGNTTVKEDRSLSRFSGSIGRKTKFACGECEDLAIIPTIYKRNDYDSKKESIKEVRKENES